MPIFRWPFMAIDRHMEIRLCIGSVHYLNCDKVSTWQNDKSAHQKGFSQSHIEREGAF